MESSGVKDERRDNKLPKKQIRVDLIEIGVSMVMTITLLKIPDINV